MLSELFLEYPSRVRLGSPKPYKCRHLKSKNCLPLSAAGDASFFRSGSGEGLSELLMEFPAVLRVLLMQRDTRGKVSSWESISHGAVRVLFCLWLSDALSSTRITKLYSEPILVVNPNRTWKQSKPYSICTQTRYVSFPRPWASQEKFS